MNSKTITASPQIAPLPKNSSKRLIDAGMMHYEASLAGFAERYTRGETSHTIHVWWARRPHSAMRALIFATLCKDQSQVAFETLEKIGGAPVASNGVLHDARYLLDAQWYKEPPRILDMFGGGGTIPMEAANLGTETYAIDANDLSVFIQKSNLEYSQYYNPQELSKAIKESGERILTQLEKETDPLFPLRRYNLFGSDPSSVFGYLWTYSTPCCTCGFRFYLSKRHWLSKKNGRRIALIYVDNGHRQQAVMQNAQDGQKLKTVWRRNNGIVVCPKCETENVDIDVRNCQDELVALIKPAINSGKDFFEVSEEAIPSPSLISQIEEDTLKELGIELPDSRLPRWSGIVNPAIYGIETHSDFLNPRQRAVLLLLIKALRDEHHRLCESRGKEFADCVTGFLSGLIDQVVDWNCRLSMWIPQNEQVGRAFSGPGVAMLWDYVETDQVLSGPANLWSKLDRIVNGVTSIPQFPNRVHVQQGYAQKLPYPDHYFDAIITDPPYYDNIFYSVLADFFYVWKRPILNLVQPELFSSPITDSSHELVASTKRSGAAQKAHLDYCQQLSLALQEAARVLKPDGIFSFVYSHSSLQGWEAIIKAYRTTNLLITSVQPLGIERKQRPRAMTSEAINTCIVFIARPWDGQRQVISLNELCIELREKFLNFALGLIEVGWKEADAGLAAFANTVGMVANAKAVSDNINDLEALRILASIVQEKLPTFSIKDRKSL
jgi:putative DNA methylase